LAPIHLAMAPKVYIHGHQQSGLIDHVR